MKIYAIIVLYQPSFSLVKEQFERIKAQVDGVIYIKNGEVDQGICHILNEKNVILVCNDENLGIATAQNQGIKKAKELNADFVILFDQDSLPSTDIVSKLKYVYDQSSINGKVALVGPVVRNNDADHPQKEDYGIVIEGLKVIKTPIREITSVSISIASGSFIPMSVLDEVGLMEESFFIDSVDTEWCLRAKSRGYSIIKTNAAFILHTLGDGTNRRIKSHSPEREYYMMRNTILLIKRRYVPLGFRARRLFFIFGRMILSLINTDFQYLRAEIKGVYDGVIFKQT